MGFFDLSILDNYLRDTSPPTEEEVSTTLPIIDSERNYWEPAPPNILDSIQNGLPRPFRWRKEDENDGTYHFTFDEVSPLEGQLRIQRQAATPASVRGRCPVLSEEQCEVMELVTQGKNIFFTGSGGTGKSFVLRCIVAGLKERFSARHTSTNSWTNCGCFSCNVAVTASTGIAALAIGGSTLHSATGIGVPRRIRDFGRMFHKELRAKWRHMKVLIIDEVSMISAETIEYLEQTLCRLRGTAEKVELDDNAIYSSAVDTSPFGGLQVILAGDFFQLLPVVPPVYSGRKLSWDELTNRGLAFQAPAWRRGNFHTVFLKKSFRQDKEDEFVTLLEDIRTGRNPGSVDKIVQHCERMLPYQHGIKPTRLFPRAKEVKELNERELARLCAHEEVFMSVDSYETVEAGLVTRNLPSQQLGAGFQESHDEHKAILEGHFFWKYCQAERIVRLKVGAQVMLLRNLWRPGSRLSLVNGSRGVIVGWTTKENALTDLRGADARSAFARTKFENESIRCLERCDLQVIPRVKFRNGETVDILPMAFNHEVIDVGECQRIQVPLKLAWAITIHKSQGMTLDYAKVALSGVFAEGQTYVALSRVKSMKSLQILNTNHSNYIVRVNKHVKAYFEELQSGTRKEQIIMKFRTIAPLYQGIKKLESSTEDVSGKPSSKLSRSLSTGAVREKRFANVRYRSQESRVVHKFEQHQNMSKNFLASGSRTETAIDDEKPKKAGKYVSEKCDAIRISENAAGGGEGNAMSGVPSSNKTNSNAPCRYLGSSITQISIAIHPYTEADHIRVDSQRATVQVPLIGSLPKGIGNPSLGIGECKPPNMSGSGCALAIELQNVVNLYKGPLCTDQQSTEVKEMERRGKFNTEEMRRNLQYTPGIVKLEPGGEGFVRAKVDTCADTRKDHNKFTDPQLQPKYFQDSIKSAAEGSRSAHFQINQNRRKGESVPPGGVAVKVEPRGEVSSRSAPSQANKKTRNADSIPHGGVAVKVEPTGELSSWSAHSQGHQKTRKGESIPPGGVAAKVEPTRELSSRGAHSQGNKKARKGESIPPLGVAVKLEPTVEVSTRCQGNQNMKKGDSIPPGGLAVKVEPTGEVSVQSARIMGNDNDSSRSNGGSKLKRQRENTDCGKAAYPRKKAKNQRENTHLAKGTYPRKLGSTAYVRRQTQKIEIGDARAVPLDSRKAPSTWCRVVTMADDCVCYFCHNEGHFASDCTKRVPREQKSGAAVPSN